MDVHNVFRAFFVLGAIIVSGVEAQLREVAGNTVLVITNPDGIATGSATSVGFLQAALAAASQPFDTVVVTNSARPDFASLLWNADGTGRYRGYVMYPPLESMSLLTPAEIGVFWDYQAKTGIRSIKYGAPAPTIGYGASVPGAVKQLYWTAAAPFGTSGVSATAMLAADGAGLLMTPANSALPLGTCDLHYGLGANPTSTAIVSPCTSTAILLTAAASPGVAGALVRHSDGREAMAFTYNCPTNVGLPCATTAKLAVSWLLAGPLPGTAVPTSRRRMSSLASMASAASTDSLSTAPATMYIEHKILVFTTPGFTEIDFLEAIFKGYGTPYDIARWDVDNVSPPKPDLTTLLWNADGSARYSSYIMFPHLEEASLMTKAEIDTLWDFARRTGARSLHVNIWLGTIGYGSYGTCTADQGSAMSFAAAAPAGVSGINFASAKLNYAGIYRCPATGPPSGQCALYNVPAIDGTAGNSGSIVTNCSVRPIVTQDADGAVVAALASYDDGRETMSFMHGCAAWSSTCLLLGHMALAWLTQNIIPGERAALLTVQTDDMFLSTYQDDTNTYFRIGPSDLNAHIAWQGSLRLPAGSSIKVEFPFNGNGILEFAGTPLVVDSGSCSGSDDYVALNCYCWLLGYAACPASQPEYCRNCTKDWAKPAGFGANNVPKPLPSSSNPNSWGLAISQDPLAAAVLGDTNGAASSFFFSHHTFTHEILDNPTLYDATQQLSLNKQMADKLGLTSRTVFSSQCMVTPGISGLTNGDALQGLWQNGLQCAVGDNTWAYLKNANNVHQMLYTTQAKNGFDNFAILPRWAAEIYFNCSTVAQNTALYHGIYPSITDYSIDAILARESTRVLSNLLALRKDPHMMHQANLRVESDGKSLVMRWIEAVLQKLTACVTWPVRSLKLDDLQQQFKLREQRDNCNLSYRLAVSTATNKVTAITVTSLPGATSGCSAPLTVAAGATVTGGVADTTDAVAPVYRVALTVGGAATIGTSLDWKPIQ